MDFKRLRFNIGYNLHFSSAKRAQYCRDHNVFYAMGEKVRLPMMVLPLYPKLVAFHSNIEIASGVRFIVHDAIHGVINQDGYSNVKVLENTGCIEIFDNVFIGAGTLILPGVKIGPNAIIGAGSVINKNIPANSVCVGVPCRQIGTYDAYVEKHAVETGTPHLKFEETDEVIKSMWNEFHAGGVLIMYRKAYERYGECA